jgi:hypothetical protein
MRTTISGDSVSLKKLASAGWSEAGHSSVNYKVPLASSRPSWSDRNQDEAILGVRYDHGVSSHRMGEEPNFEGSPVSGHGQSLREIFRYIAWIKGFRFQRTWQICALMLRSWDPRPHGSPALIIKTRSLSSWFDQILMITSFLVHRIVPIWTVRMRNGRWADPHYFKSELPFLDEDIKNLPKQVQPFLMETAPDRRFAPIGGWWQKAVLDNLDVLQ